MSLHSQKGCIFCLFCLAVTAALLWSVMQSSHSSKTCWLSFLQCLHVAAAKCDTLHRVSSGFSITRDILDSDTLPQKNSEGFCCLCGSGAIILHLILFCFFAFFEPQCHYWKADMLILTAHYSVCTDCTVCCLALAITCEKYKLH